MSEPLKFKSAGERGTTLVELIVTIVILSIALTGVVFAIQGGLSRSSDPMVQLRAVALAQAYIDEIMGKRYDEKTPNNGIPPCRASAPPPRRCTVEGSFGPDGGESSRDRFDDVDDYHGLDEGDGQPDPLQDAEGNTRDGYDNFRVQVEVRYIDLGASEDEENLSIDNELNDEEDAKLVTVTVSFRGMPDGFKFSAYKSNF